jgi:hypothetical protein
VMVHRFVVLLLGVRALRARGLVRHRAIPGAAPRSPLRIGLLRPSESCRTGRRPAARGLASAPSGAAQRMGEHLVQHSFAHRGLRVCRHSSRPFVCASSPRGRPARRDRAARGLIDRRGTRSGSVYDRSRGGPANQRLQPSGAAQQDARWRRRGTRG